MNNSEHHTMVIARKYEDGAEEWYCPTCGRRFMLQWPPQYKRIVLEPGNEEVVHSGCSGGMNMGSLGIRLPSQHTEERQIPPDDRQVPGESYYSSEDDRYLVPWARFIDGLEL